jgi:hypothetical protein
VARTLGAFGYARRDLVTRARAVRVSRLLSLLTTALRQRDVTRWNVVVGLKGPVERLCDITGWNTPSFSHILAQYDYSHPNAVPAAQGARAEYDSIQRWCQDERSKRLGRYVLADENPPGPTPLSPPFDGRAAILAVEIAEKLLPWLGSFRSAPYWFGDAVIESLYWPGRTDEIRLRTPIIIQALTARTPERLSLVVPAWSGEEPEEEYLERQLQSLRRYLQTDIDQRRARLERAVRRGRRQRISRPRSARRATMSERWAALFVLGSCFEDIATEWDAEVTNVRRLVRELLDEVGWPILQDTSAQVFATSR